MWRLLQLFDKLWFVCRIGNVMQICWQKFLKMRRVGFFNFKLCHSVLHFHFIVNVSGWFLSMNANVSRVSRSLGLGERDVLKNTNVAKVHNVSINRITQIFGELCYALLFTISIKQYSNLFSCNSEYNCQLTS